MRAIDADAFKDYIRGACEEMKHLYKDNGAWAKEITESFCKDIDEQPTIQPDNGLQKLANEIASFKRHVKSDNSDYLTGYLCALSVVEGMIADMRREVTT